MNGRSEVWLSKSLDLRNSGGSQNDWRLLVLVRLKPRIVYDRTVFLDDRKALMGSRS